MKTIGFMQEHDGDIIQNIFLDEQKDNIEVSNVKKSEKEKIINYLDNSEMVMGFTFGLHDGDNYETYIGPYKFLSDGSWIWTGHFSFYLNKSDFSSLENDFLFHLRKRNFKINSLSKEQKIEAFTFIQRQMFIQQ